jgi:hypothetical protein
VTHAEIKLSFDVSIPLRKYASQGNAILGIRDSGKTYSATFMAEQLMAGGVPIVAFDPIGVWRYLKVPGKGKGFEVVVAGGEAGDLPLTPKSAPEIVRAAMQENINLVVDLYSMELSKADWRSIVESTIRLLLYENKRHGLRHIFIEEAAEFCPQRLGPESGRVYAEIEKLARMGGNASLGYTLINQRAEEVNKAVLELCDCLLLHRQKGRNSLTALEKWLSYADASTSKEIIKTMPMLGQGECWVWMQGSNEPKRVKIPTKQSLHPDRENPHAGHAAAKAVDVGSFVERLKGSLAKVEAAKPKPASKTPPVIIQPQIVPKIIEKEIPILTADERKMLYDLSELLPKFDAQLKAILLRIKPWEKFPAKAPLRPTPPVMEQTLSVPNRRYSQGCNSQGCNDPDQVSAVPDGGRKRMLIALAQREQGLTATQLGVRAGLSSTGGTFTKYLGQLRSAGLIEGGNDRLRITVNGLEALGSFEPLPSGRELLKYWMEELGGGKARMLEVLAINYPTEMTAEQLGQETGIESTGGTFGKYLGQLKTLELVTGNRGRLRASGEFFE